MNYRTASVAAIAALSLSTSLTACDPWVTGPTTTVERQVSGYSFIEVESGFEVEVRKDSTEGVTIEAPEGAIEHINTTVSGDRLRVYLDDLVNSTFSPRRIVIRVRALRGVEVSGGTRLTGIGAFASPEFSISSSGGSRVTLDLTATRTEVEASGGSALTLRGTTDVLEVPSYSGGGRFNGFDFATRRATIDASGGSRLDVRVGESLDVDASGGSLIYYRGRPAITSDLSGGARVIDGN